MAVSARIAVREDPGPGAPVVELVDRDEHLEKERDKVDRVAIRTVSAVEILDGIGEVGLVVRRVKVDAIPAGGEEDFGPHAVRAVMIEEIRTLCPIRIIVVSAAEV